MNIIRSEERGLTDIGWLKSRHSFSFGEYYNPSSMGYRSLRVINDDIIEPGQGFGTHPHRDMEIVSLVLKGALEHRDSMGHGEVLRPGEVQVMTAGRGIQHSEFNPSKSESTHLLQIWILPERKGLPSAYGQRAFAQEERTNKLLRVAGAKQETDDGALTINQNAHVYLTRIESGQSVKHTVTTGRGIWAHLIEGEATLNGKTINPGDAVSLEGPEDVVMIAGERAAEFVLFDLN